MIISNKLQFIFFAVPKTATHAIRFAVRKYLDNTTDWEQVGLFVQKKLPFPALAQLDTGHITAIEAKLVLDEALWKQFFKFAVVRNPYDRFVSFCAFMNRENLAFQQHALSIMKETIANPDIQQRILFRPQHEFLCDSDDNLLLDFVAHYEQLQDDYTHICAHIGIRVDTLPRINRSVHHAYTSYYDEELRMAVLQFYKKDFELFSYPTTF